MQKNALKYLVNAALFVDMCAIAALGVILGFVIPRGRFYGSQKYFLGLHRHQWGNLHLYLSILLLVLLAFHLWFNRKWIVQSTKRYFGPRWNVALISIASGWILVLVVGWILVSR